MDHIYMQHTMKLSKLEALKVSQFFHDAESKELDLPESLEVLWFAITEECEK